MSTNTGNSETADSAGDSCQQDDGNGKASKRSGGGGKKTPGGKPTKPMFCSLANNMMPSFYIGGGNGVSLVEAPLLALGWKRTSDKYDERFKLKWVECKSKINYGSFKEGDQLVNHISNCHLITNKLGLLNSLQEYERVTLSTKGRLPRLKMAEFVPETYRLDSTNDRDAFLQVYKDGETWICKPTGMNQGKGIYLLRTRDEIEKLLSERDAKKEQCKPSRPLMSRIVQRYVVRDAKKEQSIPSQPIMSRIVQRYIHDPLLLDERKFDIRAFMLIANTTPYLILYHKGYVRLSCFKYNGEDTDLTTHLTNQFIQKKAPQYMELKEDTAWSMDKFNTYINEKVAFDKGLEKDWVYNTLTKQMQRIMLHCFHSVRHKLQCKVGYFDLYGLDFMIDQNMKIWLIEININPCLATNCEALKEVIPDMVEETLHIVIECFEKSRKCQALMPMNALKTFSILFCGTNPAAVAPRHARSVSPERSRPAQQFQRQGRSPGRPGPRVVTSTTPLANVTTYQASPYQVLPYQAKQIDAHPNSGQKKTAASQVSGDVKLPGISHTSGSSRHTGTNARLAGNSSSAANKSNSTVVKSQSGNMGSTVKIVPLRKAESLSSTTAVLINVGKKPTMSASASAKVKADKPSSNSNDLKNQTKSAKIQSRKEKIGDSLMGENKQNNNNIDSKQNDDVQGKQNVDTESKPIVDVLSKPNADVQSKPNADVQSKPNADIESEQNADVDSKQNTEIGRNQTAHLESRPNADDEKQNPDLESKQNDDIKSKQNVKGKPNADALPLLEESPTVMVKIDENKNNLQNVAIGNKMAVDSGGIDSIYTLSQSSKSSHYNAGDDVKLKMTHVKRKQRESSGN